LRRDIRLQRNKYNRKHDVMVAIKNLKRFGLWVSIEDVIMEHTRDASTLTINLKRGPNPQQQRNGHTLDIMVTIRNGKRLGLMLGARDVITESIGDAIMAAEGQDQGRVWIVKVSLRVDRKNRHYEEGMLRSNPESYSMSS